MFHLMSLEEKKKEENNPDCCVTSRRAGVFASPSPSLGHLQTFQPRTRLAETRRDVVETRSVQPQHFQSRRTVQVWEFSQFPRLRQDSAIETALDLKANSSSVWSGTGFYLCPAVGRERLLTFTEKTNNVKKRERKTLSPTFRNIRDVLQLVKYTL